MKNIIKKSIFILALLGLCTFATPKQAKADSSNCHVVVITCADGSVHTGLVCDQGDLITYLEIFCNVTVQVSK